MALRDAPGCEFEQLIDLCGVDYSDYQEGSYEWCRALRWWCTCCPSA